MGTLLVWTEVAAAGSRRGARLAWARGDGTESCVGVAGLMEDVKARLGWDPFNLPPDLEIEGTAQRTPRGFRADISFRAGNGKPLGKRSLESRETDCRSLGEAIAVAITVAIDPDGSGAPPSDPKIGPDPWESAAPPAPAPSPAPPVAPRRRVRVILTGGANAGLVPDVGASTGLRASFVLAEHFEVGVGAAYVPQSREGAFGFGLAAGEARGCVLPWRAEGILRLCAGGLVGAFEVYSYSTDLLPVDVGLFPWFGVEAGPVVSVPIYGPVRIELGASAIVPIVRRQGFIRGASEPLWEQSRVAGKAELGASVLF